MTYYIYCILFSIGLITNITILPTAIEKEFANQDAMIKQHQRYLKVGTDR